MSQHVPGTFHHEPRMRRFSFEEFGIGAELDDPVAYVAQLLESYRPPRIRESASVTG